MRAACEAVSAAPLGVWRAGEPVLIPRKERRKRLLFTVLSPTHSHLDYSVTGWDKRELELFFQHCIVCEGFLCVVIFGTSEFRLVVSEGERPRRKRVPNANAVKMCSCTFSPALGKSTIGVTPILASIAGLPTPDNSRIYT
jgi:hypothetical protein